MRKNLIILVTILLVSCNSFWEEDKVTITKDYVINPNWDEIANSFRVMRMKLKDSSDKIDLKSVSPPDLLTKLAGDTSFIYSANVSYNGTEYSKRKVYFNRDNDFLWLADPHGIKPTKKVLGELQYNTWYLLGGLSNVKTLYYVYIDSTDSLHTVKVPASYWANI